jgi:hypothetical protein
VLGLSFLSMIRKSGVAVVGAGGAGDVISSYVMCEVLRDIYSAGRCVPVGVLWERWILDPFPGPVPASLIHNADLKDGCASVNPETYVVRGGFRFRPQAALVAEAAGIEVPGILLDGGLPGIRRCLQRLEAEGLKPILLDVGGDILAEGHEQWLWSPLTDSLTLAAASDLSTYVIVLAPGADGELPPWYVMERIEEVAGLGGFEGVIGLWRRHLKIYERVIDRSRTEAGRIPYLALKGLMREDYMRRGSHPVDVNPTSPTAYVLEADKVIKINTLAQALKERQPQTLAEALKTAHDLGIPTELDLEIETAKTYGVGPNTHPDWNHIKQKTREKIITNTIKHLKTNQKQ